MFMFNGELSFLAHSERPEVEPHVFQQFRLVPLQRKNVVRAALHDFGRHGFLAAHRICRNNSSRYVYHVQQFRDGLDFVRFLRNAYLPRNEPVLRRECADDVVCSVFGVGRAAHGLAVHRHDAAPRALDIQPFPQACTQSGRVQCRLAKK